MDTTLTFDKIVDMARQLGETLQDQHLKLTTAESCTGGLVAAAITAISGSSEWFERGFVTYSNAAKVDMLGVKPATLEQYGAVSEQIAVEMAQGALANSQADISIAITGVAGPTGGTMDKPVGLVWFGWAGQFIAKQAQQRQFRGDRHAIRLQAVEHVLQYGIPIANEFSGI